MRWCEGVAVCLSAWTNTVHIMASFLHITDERLTKPIRRTGIAMSRARNGNKGVFCFPITTDFSVTHQWCRELKRSGARTLVCIQFRIPDQEAVTVGRYNDRVRLNTPASQAVGIVQSHSGPFGLEVIVHRRIRPTEIVRIYPAPTVTGWRYSPESKGRHPFCFCQFCNRGEIRAQRLISRGPDA